MGRVARRHRLGEPVQLTHSPTGVAEDELVDATLDRLRSFDGESIPFLTYHPGLSDRAPVLLEIHGGPEAQRRPMWIPLVQYLVGQGLAVVQPNVRGSTGYGKRFEHLDDGRLRLDTVRDVASLHDRLRSDERFDADRTVLYGGSYGGYMVLACLAFEPERWAGGVAVVPISSFVTFLRNTSEYRRAFREREYGSLEHDLDFLVEVSPITHVDRIRRRSCSSTARTTRASPSRRPSRSTRHSSTEASAASCSCTPTRATACRSSRTGSTRTRASSRSSTRSSAEPARSRHERPPVAAVHSFGCR